MMSPRLVVGSDGTQLAMIHDGRVTVVETTTMSARAEIGLVSEDSDVALVGVPPKLVAVSRLPTETRVFVVDPAGPEKLGDTTTRAGMRIGAVGGDLMMLVGPTTSVMDTRWIERAPAALPVRGQVTAAGSMGDTRIVLVVAGALEEWDLVTRAPARRLRLDRQLDVLAIGGSERRIWMVLRSNAARIEIINLETRSTRVIDMPEEITAVHAHPFIDVLVAIGASKSAYVLRADRNVPPVKLARGPVHDCAWVGTHLVVWPVDSYPEVVPSPIDLRGAAMPDETDDGEAPPAPAPAEAAPPVVAAPAPPAPVPAPAIDPGATAAGKGMAASTLTQPSFSERLASWKSKLEESRAAPAASAPLAPPAPVPEREEATQAILDRRAAGGWRGELATWARAILSRSHRPMPFLDPGVLDELMVRFALDAALRPGLALLYGAHLIGNEGSPRFELASVIDWAWEQLGGGPLARSGLVRTRGERVELVREATSALDEAAPRCGIVVGAGIGDPGSTALIAPASLDARELAAWATAHTQAPLFVANARGVERPARFVLEARIRGAVPVFADAATATAHGRTVTSVWASPAA